MTTATLNETRAPTEAENQFNWPLCYEAENLLLERIDAFLGRNSFARILSERMRDRPAPSSSTGSITGRAAG